MLYQIVSSPTSTISWSSVDSEPTEIPLTTTPSTDLSISNTKFSVCSTTTIRNVQAGVLFSHSSYGHSDYDNNLNCRVTLTALTSSHYIHVYVDEIDLENTDILRIDGQEVVSRYKANADVFDSKIDPSSTIDYVKYIVFKFHN